MTRQNKKQPKRAWNFRKTRETSGQAWKVWISSHSLPPLLNPPKSAQKFKIKFENLLTINEKMTRDIISRIHEKPFLGHIIEKIFRGLDLKSLSICKEVWPDEIQRLKKSFKRDITWAEKKFLWRKLEGFPAENFTRTLVEKVFDDHNGGILITSVRSKSAS